MSSVSEIVALEFRGPGRRARCASSGARTSSARFEPDRPRRAAGLAARRRARLGRDRGGAGDLGAARRRAPAGDRGAAPAGAEGHGEELVAGAHRRPRRAFEQLDETLLSTEYDGPTGGRAGSGSSSTRPRTRSRSGSPARPRRLRLRRQRRRQPANGAALRAAFGGGERRRSARHAARDVRRPPIRAVISDFGGVLTTPLMNSFAAFQDRTGISPESLGRAMQAIAERDGEHPLYELETGRMTEADFLSRRRGGARARARPPARDAQLQGDLLRGAGAERADDRAHARDPARRGHRMALLTNNVREWEHLWRSMLPVDEIFELVIDSGFVGMRKPDPGIYELTIARLAGINRRGVPVRRRRARQRRSRAGDRDGRGPLPRQRAGDRRDPRRAAARRLNRRYG